MMKRFLSALLCACLIVPLAGCAGEEQGPPQDLLYSSAPIQFNSEPDREELSSESPDDGGKPGGEQLVCRAGVFFPDPVQQFVGCVFPATVPVVCGVLLQSGGFSEFFQPAGVPELFQPVEFLAPAVCQQQRNSPFRGTAGSVGSPTWTSPR